MFEKFNVTCKNCGGSDIELIGWDDVQGAEAVLYCNTCQATESSISKDDKPK